MTRWGGARAALASVAFVVAAACGGGDSNEPDCDAIAAALVSRIEVTPPTATVNLGDSLQLQAVAYSCAGALGGVTAFTWRSADDGQVSVSPTGLVKAMSSGGPVGVFAAAQGKEGSASISTQPVPVARVTVEPATATVGVGRTSTLTARAFDDQDREITGRAVTWSSANQNIVTVSQQGDITGVAAGGPVAVTATIEGKSAAAQVSVATVPVSTVTVQPPTASIAAGQNQNFDAVLRDDRGNVLTGRAVTWTSSDPTIASISASDGAAQGKRPGTVTITATSEGKSGTATLTVTLGTPSKLRFVQQPASSITIGGSLGTVAVEITDAADNRITTATTSVTVALTPPADNSALGGTKTVAASGGVAGFTNLTVNAPGGFTLTATAPGLTSATSAGFQVTVPGVTITTTSLPGATVNTGYNQSLSATGGTGTYTWSIVAGALPNGLSLNANTGAITGTPTVAGTANFTVRATSGGQSDDQALSIAVSAQPTNLLTVTVTGAGASGSVSSNPSGINCTLTSGTPGGTCSFGYASGSVTLTAAPSAGTTFLGWSGSGCSGTGTCVVNMNQARNVTATFQPTLTITTASPLPGATAGTAYSQTLAASGGTGSFSAWTVTAGALPSGITLNSSTGTLSGTTSATGTFNFTVRVTSGSQTATKAFSLTVGAAPATLTVSVAGNGSGGVTSNPAGISCGTAGSDCSESYAAGTQVTLTASPAAGSTVALSGGGCSGGGPCTVTVSSATTVTATFTLQTFALNVTKAGSGAGTVSSSPGGINCGADCSQNYASGTAVTLTASAAGGSNFTGWNNCPAPSGSTCAVTMTTSQTVGAGFALNPNITTTTLVDATVGTAYSQTLAATGGTSPFTWTVTSGTLPAGLTLSTGGVISGTPTAAGPSSFTVQVTDANDVSDTQALSIDVAAPAGTVASQLGFLVQPANGDARKPITPAVQVEVRDQNGVRVASSTASVILVFGQNAGNATLSGNSVQAQGGVASFPNLTVSAPGNGYTLVATSTGLASDTSQSFRIR